VRTELRSSSCRSSPIDSPLTSSVRARSVMAAGSALSLTELCAQEQAGDGSAFANDRVARCEAYLFENLDGSLNLGGTPQQQSEQLKRPAPLRRLECRAVKFES
jgi:hypothetical protein